LRSVLRGQRYECGGDGEEDHPMSGHYFLTYERVTTGVSPRFR
jgi:hypothetical protein